MILLNCYRYLKVPHTTSKKTNTEIDIHQLQGVQLVMRTLFILSVITVAALGETPMSGMSALKITNEHLATSLKLMQEMYNTVKEKFLQIQSALMALQGEIELNAKRLATCEEIRKYNNQTGVRKLFTKKGNFNVLCEQTLDHGWIVIQRRLNGSLDFFKDWNWYRSGFGNLQGDFWLGLDKIHALTEDKNATLRVDLLDFDGSFAFASYNSFSIKGEEDNYRLYVNGHSGTANDSLIDLSMQQFSTFDKDNDKKMSGSCATERHGAWWYSSCSNSNLNGRYKPDGAIGKDGVTWYFWKGHTNSLKSVQMKIK